MFNKFSIYTMLMSYLIYYHYTQPRSVLSFQHVISRTVKTSPIIKASTATQQYYSVFRGSGIINNPTSGTPVFFNQYKQGFQTSRYNVLRLSASSSASLSSTSIVTDDVETDEINDTMAPSYPKFQNIAELHPVLKRNLQASKLETMTEIQSKTWEAASAGEDVLGRARTGTGKTVAFLLPAIQQLLIQNANTNVKQQTKIQMLILSPTRELAAQIHDEAGKLTKTAQTTISSQCMFGGAPKPTDIRMLEKQVPVILVSTPGRLKDHLENTFIHNGKLSFKSLLSNVQILVLDETDRLLDMGFKRDVESIISYLPKKEQRQTLLFSATVPAEVKAVIRETMRPKYITVDCIHDTDPGSHTNAQVSQSHVVLSAEDRWISGTVDILRKLIADTKNDNEPLKLVVFFNTAHLVGYYAALFSALPSITMGLPVYELHSRKSQPYRTRTAANFKDAKEAILFTSDVSARGVDYPGVTDVVQFGIPDSRESYIHRLGRTGRAGKQGEGMIVLSNMEVEFLKQLTGLDVPVNSPYQELVNKPPSTPPFDRILDEIANGGQEDLAASAASAYRSVLGFYNGKLSKLGYPGTSALINFANTFSKQTGLTKLPEMELQTIRKMGIKNPEGLNVGNKSSSKSGGGRGDSGRGRAGGGRGGGGGGPGRGAGRGNGGGAPRYMSTDTQGSTSTIPLKRSMAPVESNRDKQSRVAVRRAKS